MASSPWSHRLPARARAVARGLLARAAADERGVAFVILALSMTALVGVGALVHDVGRIAVDKAKLQTAVDAAALAGAAYLPTTSNATLEVARAAALAAAEANGYVLDEDDITFSTTGTQNDTIEVFGSHLLDLVFGPALGTDTATPQARAAAQVGTVTGASGVLPFGIEPQEWVFGESYCLKLGTGNCGGANRGNFHALDIDDTGNSSANVYRDKIHYGSNKLIHIGDVKSVNPGNMAGPTRQGLGCQGNNGRLTGNNQDFEDVVQANEDGTTTILDWDSPRLGTVVIVDYGGGGGATGTATVLGFGLFFIEGCLGNDAVTGAFIQTFVPGAEWGTVTNGNNYGTRAVRLIE